MSSVPRYSIMIAGHDYSSMAEDVDSFLKSGIKVIWFGSRLDNQEIVGRYPDFEKAHLIQTYDYDEDIVLMVADGNVIGYESELEELSLAIPDFNLEQYLVEHSRDKHITVRASAGTGKTTTMVDRVLYLVLAEEVRLSEIVMITFTNAATDHMSERLKCAFLDRLMLTGSDRFIHLLEELSSLRISTIDSFSLNVLKRVGTSDGFSKEASIGSFGLDTNEVILGLIDEFYDGKSSVKAALGVRLYDAVDFIKKAHQNLSNKGLSSNSIASMDWGDSVGDAKKFQGLVKYVLEHMDERLVAIKRDSDALELSDTVPSLCRCMEMSPEDFNEIDVRYLFIDEFQDTNRAQIELITRIVELSDASLFVVGDPKQSIYRFRGADDSAFDTLRNMMRACGVDPPCDYELVNNYRTDASVLECLDETFRSFCRSGLLSEYRAMIPCVEDIGGGFYPTYVESIGAVHHRLLANVKTALEDIRKRIQSGEGCPSDKVTILVRTNKQLKMVKGWFDSSNMPLIVDYDSPFYRSDAVMDFYSMISSFVFGSESIAMFNYLVSPYSDNVGQINLPDLASCGGSRPCVTALLEQYRNDTSWAEYAKKFHLRPALSVIREMLDEIPVVDNYIGLLISKGQTDPDLLKIKSRKYRANLDKLMAILYSHTSEDSMSLFNMYEFLKVSIATNRDEIEADVDLPEGGPYVCCMTIHKAKGLEFDTVIIPFNKNTLQYPRSECLVSEDTHNMGWQFSLDDPDRGDGSFRMNNTNYGQLNQIDIYRSDEEETRVLYVAMTRVIRKLYIYIHRREINRPYSWAKLLYEAGL